MALDTKTSSYISDLINQGPDALSNLYYLEFEDNAAATKKFFTNNSVLKVRAGDFKAPAFNQTTDTKNFMSVSVDFPKPEIQGEKKLSITFRVDENWAVYETLCNVKKQTSISNWGYINPYVDSYGFSIKVKAPINPNSVEDGIVDGETSFDTFYEYKNCWIISLTGLSFTYDSATPLTVTAEIGFQKFTEPDTNLKASETPAVKTRPVQTPATPAT